MVLFDFESEFGVVVFVFCRFLVKVMLLGMMFVSLMLNVCVEDLVLCCILRVKCIVLLVLLVVLLFDLLMVSSGLMRLICVVVVGCRVLLKLIRMVFVNV